MAGRRVSVIASACDLTFGRIMKLTRRAYPQASPEQIAAIAGVNWIACGREPKNLTARKRASGEK